MFSYDMIKFDIDTKKYVTTSVKNIAEIKQLLHILLISQIQFHDCLQ